MGKSEIIIDGDGLIIRWNSEDHRPPHFHVMKSDGSWNIRVKFFECTRTKLEYNFATPSGRTAPISRVDELKILGKMKNPKTGAMMHRQLFKEWKKKVLDKNNYRES